MLERVAALLASLVPPLAIICGGIFALVRWLMDRHDREHTDEGHIAQGQVIPAKPDDEWATRAYEGLARELADEQQDHARDIDRHRACHESMRAAGLRVPDDH